MIPRVFYLAAFDASRGTASTQILDRLLFFRTFQNISKINASANQAGFDSTVPQNMCPHLFVSDALLQAGIERIPDF
jgi:hypothetical protein